MTPEERDVLIGLLLQKLAEEEEGETERSLYLPSVPDNFYFDAKILRDASRVDPNVFRRLLGIK